MTTDTDKASDKLVEMALKAAFEKGWCAAAQWAQRDDLRHDTGSIAYAGQRDAILAGKAAEVRAAIIADLCGDVEPVAEFGGRRQTPEGTTEFWGVLLEPWDAPPKGSHLYSASTVAALKTERDALQARVDAMPEGFTQGIDAAAKMLDKMSDDYSNAHAVPDPDTGVYEFGRGGKEDYYNTLRELADDVRSIVYAPGERENTAQTLKAAKDAAFEQAANLLECEYAEDAKQKRRLDQIAQHIRDLKKRSS